MSYKNLDEAIKAAGNPVKMLRNSHLGPYVYPVVPPEFSNWRDEQRAWRETCVLFNQSYHMADMLINGPDALKLLSATGINSFANFPVNKAKQFVGCNYDGYVIGDAILFHLAQNNLLLVGRPSIHNWVQYHAETGGYNVALSRDERSVARDVPIVRRLYRYQVQGPNAPQVLNKLNGSPIPEIKFFNMGEINIAGRKVRALRHGMAGEPGLELWGPHQEREEIRAAIVEAGEEFGLKQVGSRAYATNTLESGWIPSPIPAVYSGEKMKPYRQWLPGNGYEATASLAGSFYSDNVEDYYLTPWDLGYGFVCQVRSRLHRKRSPGNHRQKPQAEESHAGLEWRRCRQRSSSRCSSTARSLQVPRPAADQLRDPVVRQGHTERQARWILNVQLLQLQRTFDAVRWASSMLNRRKSEPRCRWSGVKKAADRSEAHGRTSQAG